MDRVISVFLARCRSHLKKAVERKSVVVNQPEYLELNLNDCLEKAEN